MDYFGIGAALKTAAKIYFISARRTGRTTSLIEGVNSGDRIIFSNSKEADRVKRLCKDVGKEIECIVVEPKNAERLLERSTSQGRTLFDHCWVEDFYRRAIDRASNQIGFFQREMSGWQEVHIESRSKAEELAKWRR